MRGAGLPLAALALGLLVAAAPAHAQGAPPPATQAATLALGTHGGEATLEYPFTLAQDAEVYAKLLPTPWNPALPGGMPNGSITADRSAGLRGWWVHLLVLPHEGEPIDLGHFADDGASRAVLLEGGQRHVLQAKVHAPPQAGGQGQAYRVDLALAHRDVGGALDASWGLRADLAIAQAAPAPLAVDLTLPLLGIAGCVAGIAAVVGARRLRRTRQAEGPWF